ncbi:MAG: 16S rRNA (guanine(966)-N(2))-methyltransferase, partial [uncultured Nocardioides sp.]
DADHRGECRRSPAPDTQGRGHAADQRPGAGGAVLGDRVVVRLAVGPALPRPVRRVGRRRPRGLVAGRRGGHPGRAGPAYRRARRRQRPCARRPRPRAHRLGLHRAGHGAVRAVRRGLPRPALPARVVPGGRRPGGAGGPPLAGARSAGGRRALLPRRAAHLARGAGGGAAAQVRRDDALVRSRRHQPGGV